LLQLVKFHLQINVHLRVVEVSAYGYSWNCMDTPLLQDPTNADALNLSRLLSKTLKRGRPRDINRRRKLREKVFLLSNPVRSAREAGLRYVLDTMPGIRRIRSGRGFTYKNGTAKAIRDPKILQRIKALAIPPAWEDVWICPIPEGHLQATGRDSRKRKQYRYHPKWKEVRDLCKFDRMIQFGESLPLIRERVDKDLALPGLPRDKVLATIVRLLETTLIRVGNDEYARENGSYGLTTLRNNHVQLNGSHIKFRFKGKGGKLHEVGIKDRHIARILQKCQEIPGYELFQYENEQGEYVTVDSSDVNTYLREITGQDFTAKDFRTWAATVLAGMALKIQSDALNGGKRTKKMMNVAICTVASLLNNTPAVCRKSYVHPDILDGYLDGNLHKSWENFSEKNALKGLAREECIILSYLRTGL
jgi:DNA topoisomerase-1